MEKELENRLKFLEKRGVIIIDPRQTYIDENICVNRIYPNAILYPGARLIGARTFIGPGAKVGSEGPATVDNGILGENAEIASGFLKESVLMRGSRVGSNAHVRTGSLLEEEASVAHAVGIKHTILLAFVTLGSLINFCDGLISGGSSRLDHSEVGSGFIHFNFTPWGKYGDKATPSLIGNVIRGVFLKETRIFVGGLSGMVGPQKIGFGAITVAGQIIRNEVLADHIVCQTSHEIIKKISTRRSKLSENRIKLNIEYIGQLLALKAWYEDVRLCRIPGTPEFEHLRIVTSEAIKNIEMAIQERINRLLSFIIERDGSRPTVEYDKKICPLNIKCEQPYIEHVDWVRAMPDNVIKEGTSWLKSIAESVRLSFNH